MSYTLNYTGSEIDDILDRAAPGGALDTAIAAKQDALTFDAVPTEGSTNPAESGGIYDAIQAGGAAALAAFATDSVSGDVVSFPDGADSIPVKAFTGSIVPVQNLNGYDNPWPAGGGVNKYSGPATVNKGTTQYESVTIDPLAPAIYTISAKVSTTASGATRCRIALREADGTAITAVTIPVGTTRTSVTVDTTSYGKSVGRLYFYSTQDTSDTNTAVFADIQIETGSSASDYAPYSNICPISGWTGANITHKGRNIYNPNASWSLSSAYRYVNGIVPKQVSARMVFKDKDTTVDVSGASIGFVYDDLGSTTPHTYRWVMQNGSIKADTTNIPNAGDTGVYCQNLMIYPRTAATYTAIFSRWDIMVEIGVESADFEPYTADTIILDFGQTVYAGTLTALGGGLWSIQPTHAGADMGSAEWTYDATYTRFKTTVSAANYGNRLMPIYCSIYQCIDDGRALANVPDYSIYNGSSTSIYIKDTRYTDPAAIALALSGQYMVYPLASLPDPITITGEDLQTLLGANTVWTDVGSVTGLTYRADTALYIQKLIGGGGTLQTLSMASPSPSLSLGRVDVLAEPEVSEPEQTEEEAEQLEQTEESEQTEEE